MFRRQLQVESKANVSLHSETELPWQIFSIFLRSVFNPSILEYVNFSSRNHLEKTRRDDELPFNFTEANIKQKTFEKELVGNAKVEDFSENGFIISTSYLDKSGQKKYVMAKLVPSRLISSMDPENMSEQDKKIISKNDLLTLLEKYHGEFSRDGSYMTFPENGYVCTFSTSSDSSKMGKQVGFFFLGQNESSALGYAKKFKQNDTPVDYKDIPRDIEKIVGTFLTEVENLLKVQDEFIVDITDLENLQTKILRPMRFLVYQEEQGNGYLKLLFSLLSMSSALLNSEKKDIYELIEARAGIANGCSSKSKSVKADHQLIGIYFAKGCFPVSYDHNLLLGINNPYYNLVIARHIKVRNILKNIKQLPKSIVTKLNNKAHSQLT